MTVKLEVDTKQLVQDLDGFVSGIEELIKPAVLDQISRAVFSITGERFMIAADNYARMNPKKMHHVYEWGEIGNPKGRLFVLKRGPGDTSVSVRFYKDGQLFASGGFTGLTAGGNYATTYDHEIGRAHV